MSIEIGGLTLDDAVTAAVEKYAEIGGSNARVIEIKGALEAATQEELEAVPDELLAAAAGDGATAVLKLRAGRMLNVERQEFTRELLRAGTAAAFKLKLQARDPYEVSDTEANTPWTVTAPGDTHSFTNEGNAEAMPVIEVAAAGDLAAPAISDGTRAIQYPGTVASGETLVLDSVQQRAWIGSDEVSAYLTGLYPRLAPGTTTLHYTDDSTSSHSATITVRFRHRWW